MKRISVSFLVLCACFVPAAWGQKVTCPATVNWTEFLTIDMARYNPCETVLGVDNVGSLRKKGSYAVGGEVAPSPAVVNGVVYIGSYDGNVYAFGLE